MINWIFLGLTHLILFFLIKKKGMEGKILQKVEDLQLTFFLILLLGYFIFKLTIFGDYFPFIFIHFLTFLLIRKHLFKLKGFNLNFIKILFISFNAIVFGITIDSFIATKFISLYVELSLINILLSVIIGPFLEEMLYREVIYEKLNKVFNTTLTILISAILFYLSHLIFGDLLLIPYSYIWLILLGLIAGYIRSISNTIIPCLFFHSFYNLTVLIL